MALQKKHWLMIAGVAATALAIGGVFYYRKKKNIKVAEEDSKKLAEAEKKVSSAAVPPTAPENTFPLKEGSSSYEVKVLQKYINSTCKASLVKAGVYPIDIDGNWGKNTEIGAVACSTIKRNEIDEPFYRRIYGDMDAAKILPKT